MLQLPHTVKFFSNDLYRSLNSARNFKFQALPKLFPSLLQDIIHLVIESLGVDVVTAHTFYGMRLEHPESQSAFWLRKWFTVQEVRAKYEHMFPLDDCRLINKMEFSSIYLRHVLYCFTVSSIRRLYSSRQECCHSVG